MKGVILAGGNGTRLQPLTYVANKHLLPVYNKPMIYYPIETLKSMGCTDIVIVSGGEHIGRFTELLRDGSDLNVNITYKVQNEANGVAGALLCAQGLTDELFPVILGDNYFEHAIEMPEEPRLYVAKVHDPERFGVYYMGRIEEKPREPKSNLAVTGLYVYPTTVFDYIRTLKPSERGELEITDVNNWLLQGNCDVELVGYWRDMGTIDTLLEVSNHVSTLTTD